MRDLQMPDAIPAVARPRPIPVLSHRTLIATMPPHILRSTHSNPVPAPRHPHHLPPVACHLRLILSAGSGELGSTAGLVIEVNHRGWPIEPELSSCNQIGKKKKELRAHLVLILFLFFSFTHTINETWCPSVRVLHVVDLGRSEDSFRSPDRRLASYI